MRAGRPVIIYRITYDDGEEVASAVTAHSLGLPLIHSDVSLNPYPNPNLNPNPNPNTGGRGPAQAPVTHGPRGDVR